MNTRVLRIDLTAVPDIAVAVAEACDTQLSEGFKLASCFVVWTSDLVLIFQKLP